MITTVISRVILAAGIAAGSSGHATEANLTFKDHGRTIKSLNPKEIAADAAPVEVTVWDPNAADAVKYEAYPVEKLFDAVYGQSWRTAEEILLTCKDGYQPVLPAERFTRYKALFAFRRVGQKSFTLVNMNEHGKVSKLAPLYLIWDNMEKPEIKAGDGAAWPYEIVSVDLTSFKEQFPRIAPPDDASAQVKRGFVAFQKNCLGCHSLNGEGGTAGPELNYPANITEYYRINWLKKWILDPTSIRFRTGMPGLGKDVPDREKVVNDIIAYFKNMAHHKIAPPAAGHP